MRNTDAARTVKNENAPESNSTPSASVIERDQCVAAGDTERQGARQSLVDHYDLHPRPPALTLYCSLLPMSSTARLIAAALRDSPQAASLIARWEATQRAALAIAPACRVVAGIDPLEPGVCELRGETLWLSLPSPSHSAKLRQATPRLLSTLAADGFRVYEIKTRVQPAVTSYPGDGSPEPSSRSNDSGRGLPWPRTGEQRRGNGG